MCVRALQALMVAVFNSLRVEFHFVGHSVSSREKLVDVLLEFKLAVNEKN